MGPGVLSQRQGYYSQGPARGERFGHAHAPLVDEGRREYALRHEGGDAQGWSKRRSSTTTSTPSLRGGVSEYEAYNKRMVHHLSGLYITVLLCVFLYSALVDFLAQGA